MAKTIPSNTLETAVPTFAFPDGSRGTYPPPAVGADKLLTLDASKMSNPDYKYLDWASRYRGAFRLAADPGGHGQGTMRYSYGGIGFNPSNGRGLLAVGHNTEDIIAEYNIPTPAMLTQRSQITSLPMATAKQQFANAMRGTNIGPNSLDTMIHSLYSNGQRMIVSVFSQYQQSAGSGSFNTPMCVFRDVNNLASCPVDGWMKTAVGNILSSTGPICPIPASWQSALGGTHLCGLSGSTGRASKAALSEGPSAYSFNANDLMNNSQTIGNGTIPFNQLMRHYLYGILAPSNDALYNWNGAPMNNKMWTHCSEISAMFIFPGTNTVMFMGGSAGHVGGLDYGDPPWGGYKGHFPRIATDTYAYYWLVDLNDLAEVFAGNLLHTQVIPYEAGALNIPFQPVAGTAAFYYVSGIAIDEENDVFWISMKEADNQQGYGATPIILQYDGSRVD